MDKELQDIFKEKNREILITSLKYDLDKNIGSLMETITNIFNLSFDNAISKIETIFIDADLTDSNRFIVDTIENMKIEIYEVIEKLINRKKSIVLDSIEKLSFEEDKMNEYYDMILNTTKELKTELKDKITKSLYKNNNIFANYIEKKLIDNDLISERLEDYLNNLLYGKLETKIHMEIMLRDNNLINKAKEGYLRYQAICLKTEEN